MKSVMQWFIILEKQWDVIKWEFDEIISKNGSLLFFFLDLFLVNYRELM